MELELVNLRSQGKEIIATIDDILGPAEQRYFGEGYKRTQYQCSIHYQEQHAQGLISVSYRNDWSKKNQRTKAAFEYDRCIFNCRPNLLWSY